MTRLERLIPWVVLAAGLAAYFNCLHNEFVFDDGLYIVKNPYIRSLWRPREILTHSTRPAINFSFAVNYALGGLKPWGYHVVNVGIHLLAALLLYAVVRRSMESKRVQWKRAGSAPLLAGLVAMLWVVHPLQTESVTYVWQRCESLMGLFYLLTLYCVIRSDDSARANLWGAGAVVSCALGMASKEVMVTAPLMVLLYDRVFLAASWREVVRRRWGLYAGLAGTWLLLVVLMVRGAMHVGVHAPTANVAYKDIPPWSYLLTQAGGIVHYLRLTFWPHPLCLDYGTGWPLAKSVTDVLPQSILVGGLLLLTAWAWRRRPALGFVGLSFFLILAPTSSFVPIADVVFEHRMYLSLAAVIVLGVVSVVTILERLPGQWRRLEWVAGAAALALVILFAAMTMRRNEDYRSSATIWRDAAGKMPRNPRAYLNWGATLADQGHMDEAVSHYQEALQINPHYAEAHNNWAAALQRQGRLEEAIIHYQQAFQMNPNFAEAHYNWGNALVGLGSLEEALEHFQAAVRLDPNLAMAHNNWGATLAGLGRVDEAMAHYQAALRIEPKFAEAHNNWGKALKTSGRVAEAVPHFEQALQIDPHYAEAHRNWGNALQSLGRFEEAVPHYQQAEQLDPNVATNHNNWGAALQSLGRFEEATTHYQMALQIKPNYPSAHINWGNALQSLGRLDEAAMHYREALRLSPNHAQAQMYLGQVETLLQQQKKSAD
ncbi:MAG: tetratricopeptide repeat protein [Planctomycetia bacterium]|nr:tetratricopeptide repeat protein [Planctomycetia bacterium]